MHLLAMKWLRINPYNSTTRHYCHTLVFFKGTLPRTYPALAPEVCWHRVLIAKLKWDALYLSNHLLLRSAPATSLEGPLERYKTLQLSRIMNSTISILLVKLSRLHTKPFPLYPQAKSQGVPSTQTTPLPQNS